MKPFDLDKLADNGLRRGQTTGTCATACVKAALLMLHKRQSVDIVNVTLPNSKHYLPMKVSQIKSLDDGSVRADVIKFAGDDPDVTDGATIFAIVKPNDCGEIRFMAGAGVGIVTEPGIRVPIGDPAINPVPRAMMRQAVEEVLGASAKPGFDLIIGCENGEQLAKKTFNPRLGILGGISILGTTGIVEPMSLSAYMASIEVYIRVALGNNAESVAYTPGNIGRGFARNTLKLPQKRVVYISNFLGFSLETTQEILSQEKAELPTLWVLGHPGKLAKVLDGVWDTHSSKSNMAMSTVANVADECGLNSDTVKTIRQSNTVEAIVDLLSQDPHGKQVWTEIETRAAKLMQAIVPRVRQLEVRLFSMNGTAIGRAA